MVNKCFFTALILVIKQVLIQILFRPFDFLSKKADLHKKWCKFVNRLNWTPSVNSVIGVNHFEEKYVINGKRKIVN